MSKLFTSGNYFNRDNATDAITNAPGAASSLSLSGWYRASAFGNVHQPISIGTNDFDFLMVIEVDTGGNVRAYASKSSTAQDNNTASTALSTGTWYHLAATWDGATVRLYVNGAETANVAGTITSQPAITYLEMGYVTGGADALTMQDVTYWAAALTADQISQLYSGRLPRRRTNLVTHWPLFAKSGNSVDYSGNANTGLQNGTVADGTVDAPAAWNATSPRMLRPSTTTVSFSSGTSTTTTAAQGTLRVRQLFTSGTATSTTSATGTLRGRIPFTAGASTSTTAASGSLAVRKLTNGTTTTTTAAAGTLNVRKTTAGVLTSATSATGTLRVRVLFTAGALTSPSAATGGLAARLLAAGQAVTVSAAQGGLTVRNTFAAAACATTSAAGCTDFTNFGDTMFDSGASTTTTAATGTLNVTAEFAAGVATSTTAAQGGLVTEPTFAGVAASTTGAAATLRVVKRFHANFSVTRSRATGDQEGGSPRNLAGGGSYIAQKRRFGSIGLRRKTR